MDNKKKFILKNNKKEILDIRKYVKVPSWYILQWLEAKYGKKLKKNYKLTENDIKLISEHWEERI